MVRKLLAPITLIVVLFLGFMVSTTSGQSQGWVIINGIAKFAGSITVSTAITTPKLTFTSFVFSAIATSLPANGDVGYCSDCVIANPCAGSGNGAVAKRLNGIYVCN